MLVSYAAEVAILLLCAEKVLIAIRLFHV